MQILFKQVAYLPLNFNTCIVKSIVFSLLNIDSYYIVQRVVFVKTIGTIT